MSSFDFEGQRIEYSLFGEGDRILVLIHGLLMNQTMFDRLAPAMAACGNQVVTVDLLGHGLSDQPGNPFPYSMTQFARQVVALLDHLDAQEAVIGGTSLGANVALEVALIAPERVRGMLIEMPVLEHALLFAASVFTPLAVLFHFARPAVRTLGRATRKIPRSFFLADILLDWLRRDPEPSRGVLLGLLQGRVVPHRDDRVKMEMPALVIGHPSDPLHPVDDAEMLAGELPNGRLVDANSFLEWRIKPARLNAELASFLDEVWTAERPDGRVGSAGVRQASESSTGGQPEGGKTSRHAGGHSPVPDTTTKMRGPAASARAAESRGSSKDSASTNSGSANGVEPAASNDD